MGNLAQYENFDPRLLEETDELAASLGGSRFMKLTPGEHVVRFLPHKDPKVNPIKGVHEHYLNVPGRQGGLRFACPRAMTKGKERCPACEEADTIEKHNRAGNPVDSEKARELRPQLRYYANVIDRNRPEDGPKILVFGKKIYDELKGILTNNQKGGNIFNPGPKGFDIIITREGTSMKDTRYSVAAARHDSPLGNEEWIEDQWPLSEYTIAPSFEDLVHSMQSGEPVRARQLSAGRDIRTTVDVTPKKRGTTGRRPVTIQDELEEEEDGDIPL